MQPKFAVVAASLIVALSSAAAAPAAVHIKTLSNRADLISAGDVLVRVTAPAAKLGALKITAHGRDVTSAFAPRGPRGATRRRSAADRKRPTDPRGSVRPSSFGPASG